MNIQVVLFIEYNLFIFVEDHFVFDLKVKLIIQFHIKLIQQRFHIQVEPDRSFDQLGHENGT